MGPRAKRSSKAPSRDAFMFLDKHGIKIFT